MRTPLIRRPADAPAQMLFRGMSFIEVMISVLISSIIVAGLQGTIFISLKSMPDSAGVASTALRVSQTADRLAAELQTAVFVTERSATMIGFVVPDRDGDGSGERIRYAWTGTPGGALTRQYNGGPVVTMVSQLNLFSLTPTLKGVAEVFPSVGVEDAVETLLIDNSNTSGQGDNDVTSMKSPGQYFTLMLPANSYAWRATRVELMAKRNSVPGVTNVQLRPATGSLTAGNSVLQQSVLTDTSLSSSYAWQSFSFAGIAPVPSGGAICLTLQHQTGDISAIVASSTSGSGLLNGNYSNGSFYWAYDSGKRMLSRLYGKQIRSSGKQSINCNYLTSIEIAMRMTATSPVQRTTVALMNHPALVNGEWVFQTDRNPTTVDANGDGLSDWVVNGGGSLSMASMVNSVWQTSGTQLNTNPGSDFAKTTVVDVKFQNTSVGGSGAFFSMNALRSGSKCAPIRINLQKQSEGTQTLTLATQTSDVMPKTLLSISGLPNQSAWLHLIVDPTSSSVNISLNGVQYGTYELSPFASSDSNRFAAIGASGSSSEFSWARVRVLEQ